MDENISQDSWHSHPQDLTGPVMGRDGGGRGGGLLTFMTGMENVDIKPIWHNIDISLMLTLNMSVVIQAVSS